MIVTKFKVPIYEISITFIQIESPSDADNLLKHIKVGKTSVENFESCIKTVKDDGINGGSTWSYLSVRKIICLAYRCTSPIEKLNVIGHEKRHIEDRILDFFGVKDKESAALLAGFLTTKMFSVASYK